MNLHKHQLYLFEQHSESFNVWSAVIRINTEGKSLIMKLGPFLTGNLKSAILWLNNFFFSTYQVFYYTNYKSTAFIIQNIILKPPITLHCCSFQTWQWFYNSLRPTGWCE